MNDIKQAVDQLHKIRTEPTWISEVYFWCLFGPTRAQRHEEAFRKIEYLAHRNPLEFVKVVLELPIDHSMREEWLSFFSRGSTRLPDDARLWWAIDHFVTHTDDPAEAHRLAWLYRINGKADRARELGLPNA